MDWIPSLDFVWRSSFVGGCAVEMLEEGQSLNVETKVRMHKVASHVLCDHATHPTGSQVWMR